MSHVVGIGVVFDSSACKVPVAEIAKCIPGMQLP